MAASDNVSVSDGQSWNSWAEAVGFRSSEKDEEQEADSETEKRESDAMKLRKEDMELFGLCPAWDDFYLVVCEICNQVTKPQAFRSHLEQRHGSNAFSRSDRADPSLLHSNKPSTSSSSSSSSSSRPHLAPRTPSSSAGGSGGVRPSASPSLDKLRRNHHGPSLSPVVRVERMLLQGKLLPGERKELPSPQQPPPITPGGAGLLAGPGPGGGRKGGGQQRERKLLPCKDREYDPNKHCGVMVGEAGKPCTRSLTCKTHSLSLRRAVPGRKKNFDDLLMDHRAAKEAALSKTVRASAAARPDGLKTPSPAPPASPAVAVPTATSSVQSVADVAKHASSSEGVGSKANSNLGHHKPPGAAPSKPPKPSASSSSSGQKTGQASAKSCKPAAAPSPAASCGSNGLEGQAVPSSSASSAPAATAGSTERRRPDHSNDPYVQHHPRPAAICTFGLRQLGNGLFLLDRRWDCARSALRLALGSERSGHPPPLKKLCVESRLPQAPETSEDPSDPYNFTCVATGGPTTAADRAGSRLPAATERAGSKPAAASPCNNGVGGTPAPHGATPRSQPAKNASKTTPHPKQPHRTKDQHPVSNGGISPHPVAKKKKVGSTTAVPTASVVPAASTPIAISAAPISFPFRVGALSRLQVATGRSATGKDGNGSAVVMATVGDVLNGRVNSVHSVKFSRPPSVGTGAGLATLVGQLQCRTEDSGGAGGNKGPPGKVGGTKGGARKVSPASRGAGVERTSSGATQRNHHHHQATTASAASELSNLKVPPMTMGSLPNGLLASGPNHASSCAVGSSDHPAPPGARGPRNGSKPVVSTDAGAAKPPLAAYQQVFTSQVQAQLVQTPASLKFPLLLPNDERRPRTPQLKVPGGSLPA